MFDAWMYIHDAIGQTYGYGAYNGTRYISETLWYD